MTDMTDKFYGSRRELKGGHFAWLGQVDDPTRTTPMPVVRYVGDDGNPRHESAFRISWQEHYGPIPEQHAVMNGCGARGCTAPDHLVCVPWRPGMTGAAISWALAAKQGRKRRGLITDEELRCYEENGRK